jgi:AraC family transcriptional regulator of adaptative response / DNA-3-methyladenine glycosylase II
VTTVAAPSEFDFAWAIRFLAAREVPCLEHVTARRYARAVRLPTGVATLEVRMVRPRDGTTSLVVRAAPRLPAAEVRKIVTRLFDLDADVGAFRRLCRRDPILRRVVSAHSAIRLPQFLDPFEGLIRAILGQQVSLSAASTMADRLVRLFDEPAPPLGERSLLVFPAAEQLVAAGFDRLQSIGLTRSKTTSLLAAAEAVIDGTLNWPLLRAADETVALDRMVSVRGIGPWTASYVRMRALGDRDGFPAADLGIIKAMASLGIARGAIAAAADRWRPWRGYATLHLWNSLSAPAPATRRRRLARTSD